MSEIGGINGYLDVDNATLRAPQIGIANTTPQHALSVGSNLYVSSTSPDVLTVDGNVVCEGVKVGLIEIYPSYGFGDVSNVGNATANTIQFTNATTAFVTSANIEVGTANLFVDTQTGRVGVGTNAPAYDLDVHGTANVGVLTANLPIATIASNLVTYDKTTGELFDSAGLFSNKLAVVSEQPPAALTGATTTIENHGTYTIATGDLNLFDKNDSTTWTGTYATLTLPYKATLRHLKMVADSFPTTVTVEGSNNGGLTWDELATPSGAATMLVNATAPYKKYKFSFGGEVTLKRLDLFAESFSIDGGKVAMASSAVMGGETMMDQHGPHGRGVAVLKKYPEIAFAEGKYDITEIVAGSNQYWDGPSTVFQGGYSLKTTQHSTDSGGQFGWMAFDENPSTNWKNAEDYDTSGNYDYGYTGIQQRLTDTNSTNHDGDHVIMGSPSALKMAKVTVTCKNSSRRVVNYSVLGSNSSGTTGWTLLDSGTFPAQDVNTATISSPTSYFKYHAFVVRSVTAGINGTRFQINSIDFYGYEEDPPAGDTSVDTTFTSIMNTPQTTGVQVYVDGNLGETFTNRVTGPTPTGTATTYNATGKYWELTGALTSNVTLEANTFLEGDAPHSVSVWFNSSNLEANTANTCVFSISDQEKLDSVNLDLQSNTWHNLTYAYQGEGGSRVTYLDGRKVAEDQAEDTFGEYPPFAMTGYSQGGYVVTASSEYDTTYPVWEAFNNVWHNNGNTNGSDTWLSENATNYNGVDGLYSKSPPSNLGTGAHNGEWVKIEMPHKFKLDYITIYPRYLHDNKAPRDFIVYGSNDNINWSPILTKTGASITSSHVETGHTFIVDVYDTCYKYFGLVTRKLRSNTTFVAIAELKFYGHRENDLVRLPDPTNVWKYPHIAMTGPAQRGYVASANGNTSEGEPWEAFLNSPDSDNGFWHGVGVEYDVNNNSLAIQGTAPSTNVSGSPVHGAWIQLQFPHSIIPTRIDISPRRTQENRAPRSGVLAGSDNGTDWYTIYTISEATNYTAATYKTFTFTNTTSYKYLRLIVTQIGSGGTGVGDKVNIGNIELYGTGVDSVPIQIGGGNIDRVANFRVYDKFIGEDQALEIWDSQKDVFREVKNSMTLHKGRLGIGTTEPEGRLAVADEPDPDAYGLQEFPPKPLAGYETYIEDHGVYKVSISGLHQETVRYAGWKAFDDNADGGENAWITYDPSYNNGTQTLNKRLSHDTALGEYIVLEFPYKVKISLVKLHERSANTSNAPSAGVFYGSNDGVLWTELKSFSGLTYDDGAGVYSDVEINATDYFNRIALVVTNIGSTGSTWMGLGELRYFGYREQVTKHSVLHDGQLTLTKSLTVPRIGPALDADNTPRRDRLVVEYNTSTNPTFEGAVRDTSGRGNDGVFVGGASYDATEKALKFIASSNQYVNTNIPLPADGNFIHSMSMWFNPASLSASTGDTIVFIGDNTDNNKIEIFMETDRINYLFGGNNYEATLSLTNGRWYHLAVTYNGTVGASGREIYIDGVQRSASHSGLSELLNLTNGNLDLGRYTPSGSSSAYAFDGSISNFKLYDVALTAQEVKTLYDMGRCDEGHHVVNFSKTRVGIGLGDGEAPRGALDVRGDIVGGCPAAFSVAHNPTSLSGEQTIVWNLVYHNVGGGYNPSNGMFTAPVSGYYHFTVWGMTSGNTSGVIELQFMKNGSTVQQRPYGQAGGNYGNATGSIIEYLSVGDTMSITLTTGTTMYGSSSQSYNGFSGFYLSS